MLKLIFQGYVSPGRCVTDRREVFWINFEKSPYLLQSAATVPTTGIQTPSAGAEAEQVDVGGPQVEQRQAPPVDEAAADEAAPAEAVAGGERQRPRQPPPPPRSGGDAAADPSARKENLKRKEERGG